MSNLFSSFIKNLFLLVILVMQCAFSGSLILALSSKQIINSIEKIRPKLKGKEFKSSVTEKDGLPQTLAYLSIPELKENVELNFSKEIKEFNWLIERAIEKELEYFPDYYVFYHGQNSSYRLYQDIVKEFTEWLNLVKITNQFLYLREPSDIRLKNRDLHKFLQKNLKKFKDCGFDNVQEVYNNLLSVNLSLFGNTSCYGECSFKYFISSRSIAYNNLETLLSDLFKAHNFNTKYIQQFLQEYDATINSQGNLLQIFIPKDLVDKFVYLAKPFGIPLDQPILNDFYDAGKNRHTAVSPILNLYRTEPTKIEYLDLLQARIFINSDILDPNSGVKIFRYTTADNAVMKKYKANIKALVKEVLADWIKNRLHLKIESLLSSYVNKKSVKNGMIKNKMKS